MGCLGGGLGARTLGLTRMVRSQAIVLFFVTISRTGRRQRRCQPSLCVAGPCAVGFCPVFSNSLCECRAEWAGAARLVLLLVFFVGTIGVGLLCWSGVGLLPLWRCWILFLLSCILIFLFFCNGNFHCVKLSRCKVICKGDVVMIVTCLEVQNTLAKCGDSVPSFSLFSFVRWLSAYHDPKGPIEPWRRWGLHFPVPYALLMRFCGQGSPSQNSPGLGVVAR